MTCFAAFVKRVRTTAAGTNMNAITLAVTVVLVVIPLEADGLVVLGVGEVVPAVTVFAEALAALARERLTATLVTFAAFGLASLVLPTVREVSKTPESKAAALALVAGVVNEVIIAEARDIGARGTQCERREKVALAMTCILTNFPKCCSQLLTLGD